MNTPEALHFYELAQAYVDDLADKADCIESVNEIRALKVEGAESTISDDFNAHIDAVCDHLAEIFDNERDINLVTCTNEEIDAIEKAVNHKLKMINRWKGYIEEEEQQIKEFLEDGFTEDDVAIREARREIRQHGKDIAKYEKELEAM